MFKAYTEQLLAPTLTRGDIVFMDNVSVHKVDGVEEAIEARGAIPFYLLAYSPDLNPIEKLFAKLKALLRKIASYTLKNSAFTVRSLCKTIASCLNQLSKAECAAYLANSGYGQSNRHDHADLVGLVSLAVILPLGFQCGCTKGRRLLTMPGMASHERGDHLGNSQSAGGWRTDVGELVWHERKQDFKSCHSGPAVLVGTG
jgi:transposase